MTASTCSNCLYAQAKGNKFECHRVAPLPVIMADTAGALRTEWPLLKATDWCYSWRLGVPRP